MVLLFVVLAGEDKEGCECSWLASGRLMFPFFPDKSSSLPFFSSLRVLAAEEKKKKWAPTTMFQSLLSSVKGIVATRSPDVMVTEGGVTTGRVYEVCIGVISRFMAYCVAIHSNRRPATVFRLSQPTSRQRVVYLCVHVLFLARYRCRMFIIKA